MRNFLGFFLIAIYCISSSADETGDIANIIQDVPRPDYSSFLNQETLEKILPEVSTDDIENLKTFRNADGSGDITSLGTEKSVACDTKGDPECLALQLLKRGASVHPTLSEAEKENLLQQKESVHSFSGEVNHAWEDLVSEKSICHDVSTLIPARLGVETCDIGQSVETLGTCRQTYKPNIQSEYLYECLVEGLTQETRCVIQSETLSHEETFYTCSNISQSVLQKCDLEADTVTHETFLYSCSISQSQITKTVCTKTLSVEIGRFCTTNMTATLSLTPFVALGYRASGAFRTARITVPCNDQTPSATVTFGTRTAGTVLSGSSIDYTYYLTFHIAFSVDDEKGTLAITNEDTGLGSVTQSVTFDVFRATPSQIDSVTESCQQEDL